MLRNRIIFFRNFAQDDSSDSEDLVGKNRKIQI